MDLAPLCNGPTGMGGAVSQGQHNFDSYSPSKALAVARQCTKEGLADGSAEGRRGLFFSVWTILAKIGGIRRSCGGSAGDCSLSRTSEAGTCSENLMKLTCRSPDAKTGLAPHGTPLTSVALAGQSEAGGVGNVRYTRRFACPFAGWVLGLLGFCARPFSGHFRVWALFGVLCWDVVLLYHPVRLCANGHGGMSCGHEPQAYPQNFGLLWRCFGCVRFRSH